MLCMADSGAYKMNFGGEAKSLGERIEINVVEVGRVEEQEINACLNRGNKLMVTVESVSRSLREQPKLLMSLEQQKHADYNCCWSNNWKQLKHVNFNCSLSKDLGNKTVELQRENSGIISPAVSLAPNLSIVSYNNNPVSKKLIGKRNKEIAKQAGGVRRKQKSLEEILGVLKASEVKRDGRRKKQKCVVFRSTIAAAALSVSTDGINNRNRILLDEAQAVLSVTKIMGEDYVGDEEEVISRIMIMEEQDSERFACMK